MGYWPQGSVYVWQYGNNVYPVQSYTKTLQPYLSYATVNNSSNQYLLYLQNNWNANGTVGNDVECFGSAVVNTSMTCLSQGYGYDNLNRLTSAGENYYQNPGSGAGYSRNFSYDEYGNMSVSASSNVPTSGLMPQTSQSPFNTANNQLKTATYADPRGNMTLVAAGSVSMSYDGESRQTKTVDPGTGVTMNYLYDGAGQRVQKQSSNGTTTVDVHDVFGQLVAEYSSVGVTPACTTCYLTYDGLGSVRLVTDQNAGIVTRHDYLPYGEEIPNGSAGRCCNNFGNTANVTQMFTGQERDGGTADLDFFNARHMSNILGRFTQPDPGGAGADKIRPQTWNAYTYVLGNPLAAIDPSGLGDEYNDPGGPWAYGGGFKGSSDGNCAIDGIATSCGVTAGVVHSGAAVICPNNSCSNSLWVNNSSESNGGHWATQVYSAFALSSGYFSVVGPGSINYSVEQAGIAAVKTINPTSVAQNIEYSGNIYKDASGIYSYTQPVAGTSSTSMYNPNNIPDGTAYAGNFHTHGGPMSGFDSETFSYPAGGQLNDIGHIMSANQQGMPSFLGTPAGRIEGFFPSQGGPPPFGCVLVGPPVPGLAGVPACH